MKKNKLVKQLILRGRTLGFWGRGVEMSRWDTGTRPTILDKIEGNSNPPLPIKDEAALKTKRTVYQSLILGFSAAVAIATFEIYS